MRISDSEMNALMKELCDNIRVILDNNDKENALSLANQAYAIAPDSAVLHKMFDIEIEKGCVVDIRNKRTISTIHIKTWAYNAEKTIGATIDSVLKQTYPHFIYYILDNGSTDKTLEVIKSYAEKDNRIVVFHCDVNRDYEAASDFWELENHIPDGDYYCNIDADDLYSEKFFEEMLKFAKENNLDIVASGSATFDNNTNEIIRVINKQFPIICKEAGEFDYWFRVIHWNMRQLWGKLYSSKAAHMMIPTLSNKIPNQYGADTYVFMNVLREVANFGVLDQVLHYYRRIGNSVSNKWNTERIEANIILFEETHETLKKIADNVSDKNREFLLATLFSAMRDCAIVITNSKMSPKDTIDELKKITDCQYFHELYMKENEHISENDKKEIILTIISWLELSRDEAEYCKKIKSEYLRFED